MDPITVLENDIARLERAIARAKRTKRRCRIWYQKLARLCFARGRHPSFVEKAQVQKDQAYVGNAGFSRYSAMLAKLDKLSW